MSGLNFLIGAQMLLMPHTMCFPVKEDMSLPCDSGKTAPCPSGHACKQDNNGDFRCLSNEIKRLDDYILHHEVLTYNTDHLHMLHMRHKRSLDSSVHFELNAFNRKFRLRLRNDLSVFTPDFVLEFNGTTRKPDLSFIYSGEVIGKPESTVIGGILKGVFTGSIFIPSEQETYHIELSNRFFQEKPVFHSVIYKESDMNLDPFRERRKGDSKEAAQSGTFGYERALEWTREVAGSEIRHESLWEEGQTHGNEINAQLTSDVNSPRRKRASLIDENDAMNSCSMSLMSDPFLYNTYLERFYGDTDLLLNAILLLIATHVQALKTIYINTTFETDDGSISYNGMAFSIKNTKIMTPSDCSNIEPPSDYKDPDDTDIRLCNPNIDAVNFLNLISLKNHDGVCLAYSFTSRDFAGGLLGLAWYGATDNASGGACERFKEYQENNNRVRKSLNTGFITTKNYGTEMPARVSQLIFAHEVGHSFGSLHDSETDCAPYETSALALNQDSYIMYAGATMGNYQQNSEFSKCSKDSIARLIHAILNSPRKYNCFEESRSYCGNEIVEPGEDCDCGFHGDCVDSCCVARNAPNYKVFCKLKAGAQCSPSQGPCCASTCTFTPATPPKICRSEEECYKQASCDGKQARCPNSVQEPDGTFCNDEYELTCKNGETGQFAYELLLRKSTTERDPVRLYYKCREGTWALTKTKDCVGSLCERFGWTQCFPTITWERPDRLEKACELGCTNEMLDDCIMSSETETIMKYPEFQNMLQDRIDGLKEIGKNDVSITDTINIIQGYPCNNYKGFCDKFLKCRDIDLEFL